MPRVAGIESFREAMAGHENEYVLIGGGACSILFDEVGADFRLTKDLDIVVLVDDASPSFARALWEFVRAGGYEAGKRGERDCSYYRFTLPAGSSQALVLPGEIELFARHPDFVLEDERSHVAPLPFDETVSSLSAIILDDGYYDFIKANVTISDGVPLLSALHIIPLKMRAHVDNRRLHDSGVRLSQKVLRKHRADVAALAGLLPANARLRLEGQLREDAEAFFEDFEEYASRETSHKRRAALEEILKFLRGVYQ